MIWRDNWKPYTALILGVLAILMLAWSAVPARAEACAGHMATVSWYGSESGNRTANGRFFDGTQMLAAHKSLKFGTRVRFTYRGKSVTVPIEDRGPYIRGREYDLSRAAAVRIGLIHAGVAKVCVQVL